MKYFPMKNKITKNTDSNENELVFSEDTETCNNFTCNDSLWVADSGE